MTESIEFTLAEKFLIDVAIPCEDCGDAFCDGFCLDSDDNKEEN